MSSRLEARVKQMRSLPLGALIEQLAPGLGPLVGQGQVRVERHLTPWVTFWLFLYQVLCGHRSCAETVAGWISHLMGQGKASPSPNTSAYCQARERLPLSLLHEAQSHLRQESERVESEHGLWKGRTIRILDGSSLSMPDTKENQERFPQPSAQQKGCGFPVMRLMGVFSWHTGMLLQEVHDALSVGEGALIRRLLPALRPDQVVLCDRVVAGFADLWTLLQAGVQVVTRRHARRSTGVRLHRVVGEGDRLIWCVRPSQPPAWMSREQATALPGAILLREVVIRTMPKGFRPREIIVWTTLLDAEAFSHEDVAGLFRERWKVETHYHQIKTLLKAEILSCKSPAMIEKEWLVHALAYNLVRCLMGQAAHRQKLPVEKLSFQGVLSHLRQWAPMLAAASSRRHALLYAELLGTLGKLTLPHRPGRGQPRAVKRRPKSYQRLTKPRQRFREIPHRNRYRKESL